VGQDDFVLGGNLILDLPKIGWLQGGYDSFYGASAGVGFNLNRRLSIGYTMEKGLSSTFDNFGVTHEISFAYSFTPNLTEDRVMLEADYEESLAEQDVEKETEVQTDKDTEIAELKRRLAENDAILAELMFRQDSLENNRQRDLENRFEMVMRMVRQETGGNRPDLEDKARQVYYLNNDQKALAANDQANEPIGIKEGVEAPAPQKTAVKKEVLPAETKLAARQPEPAEEAEARAVKRDAVAQAEVPATQPVQRRQFRDLQDVQDGYYVVANVYRGSVYLNKFMDRLSAEGLQPDFIDNPNNGLKYVYLQRFDSWQDAEKAVRSQLNGSYSGELWVMNVANRYSNEAYAANAEKIKDTASRYEADVLRKNVVERDKVAAPRTENQPGYVDGTGSGYYIIVNVFANPGNAARFIKHLNSLGLSASYFVNPQNNYRYVYLKRHETWNSALISYYSKINDTYDEKMWIMRVTPNLIA
ncbi:MAG TPA: type IX secretion system membrane protein PorP/SprF, partial [Robiginitalea sp.]|nr:type IX secretion system membrane protein PorP/SprF [Robiginitalea sp.]